MGLESLLHTKRFVVSRSESGPGAIEMPAKPPSCHRAARRQADREAGLPFAAFSAERTATRTLACRYRSARPPGSRREHERCLGLAESPVCLVANVLLAGVVQGGVAGAGMCGAGCERGEEVLEGLVARVYVQFAGCDVDKSAVAPELGEFVGVVIPDAAAVVDRAGAFGGDRERGIPEGAQRRHRH